MYITNHKARHRMLFKERKDADSGLSWRDIKDTGEVRQKEDEKKQRSREGEGYIEMVKEAA